ncbi:MAG: HAMP domain-containing histidine kinase [Candidatus Eisenbacteria bacterium]|uniref:histidine kinase n=1 Tax=Eiseniibacteriota bacterium TaxID=2212470 RepID=A0A956LZI1_UNCEI|nr:HAMP domain-containing histidine kinase [Candidatus Eisenbacteria bacterium]
MSRSGQDPRGNGGRARLRLSHRLLLLFLLAGAIPLGIVALVGWIQFRQQARLGSVSSVEHALEASLRSHRRTMDRLQRQLEDLGQTITTTPEFARAVPEGGPPLQALLATALTEPPVDFALYLQRTADGWHPLAQAGLDERPSLPLGLPDPEAGNLGPQRARPLPLRTGTGDLVAVPTYLWQELPGDTVATARGCLILATFLGRGFFDDFDAANDGLIQYRRFLDLTRITRAGNAILAALALVLSLAIGLWLARNISRGVSRPVETLVRAMDDLGSGETATLEVRSRIPEMEILGNAFARMRGRLRDYEEQLREAEQVRGAQTARFVAHEIRNALTPVQAGIAVLARRVAELPADSRPQGERALEGIRAEAARMASLASAFSDYAHLPDPTPAWLDPVPVLEALSREVPPGVHCSIDVEPLPQIWADRDEVERMLRNLVKNAVEAMNGDGSLRISGRTEESGTAIRIEIADSGPGMDPKTLEQAFHPGFTTKPAGSGLGLALVRGTILRMGGRLAVESEVGHGTRVTLRMPAARKV